MENERLEIIRDFFRNMKPFESVDDIPDIPCFKDQGAYTEIVVDNLIRCGAIPKSQLEKGAIYEGNCRNATQATWDGEKFSYERSKFGSTYIESINHFEDDDGYDVFVPWRKIGNMETLVQ